MVGIDGEVELFVMAQFLHLGKKLSHLSSSDGRQTLMFGASNIFTLLNSQTHEFQGKTTSVDDRKVELFVIAKF
jgi:hypothetical protein